MFMESKTEKERPDHVYIGVEGEKSSGCFGQPVDEPDEMSDEDLLTVTFGDAIVLLKAGLHVQRLGWNGKGMWLALQRPDANSKMSLPYIYMHTAQGEIVPWLASQSDMLETDWVQV